MEKCKLNVLALLFVLIVSFPFTSSSAPPLIDNEQVRVVPISLRRQQVITLDSSDWDSVIVYLNSGMETLGVGSGRESRFDVKPGDARWISRTEPGEKIQLSSDSLMDAIQVVFKQGCLRKAHFDDVTLLDPVIVDPAHYSLAFENDCARVLRAKFGPHERAPMHQHIRSRVVIYLTDQKTRVTGADGNVSVTTRKTGEVSWGIPAKHTEENLWPTPFEAVVVEPKN